MRSWYRNIDPVLILLWLLLCGVGLMAIYSATHGPAQQFLLESVQHNFERQFMWLGISFVGLVIVLLLPTRFIVQLSIWTYVGTVFLLVAALLFGREVGGARSWISLGPASLQVSELAKVGTILAVAVALSNRLTRLGARWKWQICVGLLLLPAALIVLQNDTGTALVFVALIPVILLWGGLSPAWVGLSVIFALSGYLAILSVAAAVVFAFLAAGAYFLAKRQLQWALAAGIAAAVAIGGMSIALNAILKPHQVARIASFPNPEAAEYRSSVGFHLVQSKAAVGSGGLWGQGFMEGSQTQGRYIPEQSTDFIFTVIGEEWGFAGSVIVLLLYTALILRLIWMAAQISHPFGSMVAAGAAGVFLIHVCVNVGMVLGMLPVIGIPLPFLSYGGSALLVNSTLVGLALCMYCRRDEFSLYV